MDMLRAIKFLEEDLLQKNDRRNKVFFYDSRVKMFAPYGVNKARIVHFYGKPDIGKTTFLRSIMIGNEDKSFLYVSNKLDDIRKMERLSNINVFISNIFEETIDYLESVDKNLIDVVVLDNFNNMLSREELLSAFTKKLDNRAILEKYIKRISQLAVEKNFVLFIMNSINAINEKSRYGYLIDKEAVASIRLDKISLSKKCIKMQLINERNLLSDKVDKKTNFVLHFDEGRYL